MRELIELSEEKYFDYSTLESIKTIFVPENVSAYNVSYVLQRKATQHKRNGRMDLAIECLRKSNELVCSLYARKKFHQNMGVYLRLCSYLEKERRYDESLLEMKNFESWKLVDSDKGQLYSHLSHTLSITGDKSQSALYTALSKFHWLRNRSHLYASEQKNEYATEKGIESFRCLVIQLDTELQEFLSKLFISSENAEALKSYFIADKLSDEALKRILTEYITKYNAYMEF